MADVLLLLGTMEFHVGKDAHFFWPQMHLTMFCDWYADEKLISPCMCKGTQQFVHRSYLDHRRSVKEVFSFSHCTTCHAQFHLRIKFRTTVIRVDLLSYLAAQTVCAVFAYLIDKDGAFKNLFKDRWFNILSMDSKPLYYYIGVVAFFLLLGICGFIFQHFVTCWCLINSGWGTPAYSPFAASIAAFSLCLSLYIAISAIFDVASDCLGDCSAETLGRVVYCFNDSGLLSLPTVLQKIWKKDNRILTKRELTKEYIVEDMHGCYTPPKSDPKFEERLKMLKLL